MGKVYIPIVIVLLIACIFTIVQWQLTDSQLHEYQLRIQSLTSEIDWLQAVTTQQQEEIESKATQISNLNYEVDRVELLLSKKIKKYLTRYIL